MIRVCLFSADPDSRYEESFESLVKVQLAGYGRRLEGRGANAGGSTRGGHIVRSSAWQMISSRVIEKVETNRALFGKCALTFGRSSLVFVVLIRL